MRHGSAVRKDLSSLAQIGWAWKSEGPCETPWAALSGSSRARRRSVRRRTIAAGCHPDPTHVPGVGHVSHVGQVPHNASSGAVANSSAWARAARNRRWQRVPIQQGTGWRPPAMAQWRKIRGA
jgi:hypothetical protein